MKKISLRVIKNSLTRNEMRSIVGGCAQGRCASAGNSCWFDAHCYGGCHCDKYHYCSA